MDSRKDTCLTSSMSVVKIEDHKSNARTLENWRDDLLEHRNVALYADDEDFGSSMVGKMKHFLEEQSSDRFGDLHIIELDGPDSLPRSDLAISLKRHLNNHRLLRGDLRCIFLIRRLIPFLANEKEISNYLFRIVLLRPQHYNIFSAVFPDERGMYIMDQLNIVFKFKIYRSLARDPTYIQILESSSDITETVSCPKDQSTLLGANGGPSLNEDC